MVFNRNHLISIDGGGTKTEFCIYNIDTDKKEYFKTGSSNYKISGERITKNNLIVALKSYLSEYKISKNSIKGMVIGIAGCDNDDDKEYYKDLIKLLNISPKRIYMCNDAEVAFHSTGSKNGIVVIAGTGSICMGIKKDGNTIRSGGWGFPISDLGSGIWMSSMVLQDLVSYCEGYGEYKEIFSVIKDELGTEKYKDIPKIITSYKLSHIAGFAKLIMDKAYEGDRYCKNITDNSMQHLLELTISIQKRLSDEDKKDMGIVLSGGLFSHEFFKDGFIQKIKKEFGFDEDKIKLSICRPVDGGLNIAKSKFLNNKYTTI